MPPTAGQADDPAGCDDDVEVSGAGEVPVRAGGRAAAATVGLAVLWAAAFTGVTPLYPTLLVGGAAMAAAAWWVWSAARQPVRLAAIPPPFPALRLGPSDVWLALVAAAVHYLVGAALYRLASRFLPAFAETASATYDQAGGAPLWIAVLVGGLVSAPLEEVFWRGAVQPVVASLSAQRWPALASRPWVPVVATAVAYGLFHLATTRLALVAAALLGGLVWGWLLHRTRSLGAVMLAHAVWTVLMLVVPPGSTVAVAAG